MSIPPSPHAPVEPRHRELATLILGSFTSVDGTAQLLADAEAQAVNKMREWKDSGYKTIEDFRTALKAWGKTQDEMIAMVEMLLKYHEEMADINGPLHRAELELSSLQEQLARATEDSRLLDEYERLFRQDDVESHQISEDECEQILRGHFWRETTSVESTSLRVAMQASIDAARSGSPPGQKDGGGGV